MRPEERDLIISYLQKVISSQEEAISRREEMKKDLAFWRAVKAHIWKAIDSGVKTSELYRLLDRADRLVRWLEKDLGFDKPKKSQATEAKKASKAVAQKKAIKPLLKSGIEQTICSVRTDTALGLALQKALKS